MAIILALLGVTIILVMVTGYWIYRDENNIDY